MTFYSLADGCRLLDIDPKTLHRWLAQAHLPVQRHPTDGRKTGLSVDHLQQLACLHHRSLPAPRCLSQVIGLVDLRYQGPECRGKREISQFRVGPLGRVLEWICSAS